MALADLTTAAAVQTWCGVTPSTSADAQFSGLATAASRVVMNYINRPALNRTTFVELYDGNGKDRMLIRNWPVASISSLMINGITIPQSTGTPGTTNATANGYWLESAEVAPPGQMQSLYLYGYCFQKGIQNIGLSYVAGYFISGEAQAIVSGGETITVDQPFGPWSSDLGVTFANGTALTAVSASATPTTGQYQIVAGNPGQYKFAAADDGKGVLISYNYTPQDLFQATTELAGERYSYKARIGQTSRSVGGQETTSFSLKSMPDFVKAVIDQFRNVVPY